MQKPDFKPLLDKPMSRKEFLGFALLAFASIFGITALIKELASHASTPTASTEVEVGTRSGPVVQVTDSTASGGKAVEFKKASTGGSSLKQMGWGLIVATNSGTYSGTQNQLYQLAWQYYGNTGTGTGSKFYDGGAGIAKTVSSMKASGYGTKVNETAVQLCWKGNFILADYLAACRTCIAMFPNRILRTTYWQEGDRPTGISPADMQSKIQSQYNAIHSTSDLPGKVEVWPCFTTYNQVESPTTGRLMEDFIGPYANMVGAISIDIYQFQGSNVSQTWNAATLMNNILTRANAMGLPVHMSEMGCTFLGGTDTDAKRAARTKSLYDWGKAHPYNSSTGLGSLGGDYYENYSGVDGTTTTGPVGLLKDASSASPQFPQTFNIIKSNLTS